MPWDLTGKKIVVVGGGGGGIGACCTQMIGASGGELAIIDIDSQRAEEAARDVVAAGGKAVGLVGDVASREDIDRVVAEADQALGGIDALVTVVGGLNAFKISSARVTEETDEDWDTVIDLNLRYVFRMVRAVIPRMLQHDRGGTIVAIGSFAGGTQGAPMMASYGAAKAAVGHLALTVTAEFGPQNIRMNVVSPGWIATPVGGQRSDEQTQRLLSGIPLRHRGKPEDIAHAVLFMLSPGASYISGQMLAVDGGAAAYSHLLNARVS